MVRDLHGEIRESSPVPRGHIRQVIRDIPCFPLSFDGWHWLFGTSDSPQGVGLPHGRLTPMGDPVGVTTLGMMKKRSGWAPSISLWLGVGSPSAELRFSYLPRTVWLQRINRVSLFLTHGASSKIHFRSPVRPFPGLTTRLDWSRLRL